MKYLILFLMSFNLYAQTAKIGVLNKTVTTAGTAERLSSTDLIVRMAEIQAASDNTGLMFIGTSSSTASAANGIALTKGTATVPSGVLEIGNMSNQSGPRVNLKDIWVDSATNGDQVNVLYVE